MEKLINTDSYSNLLRSRAVDLENKKLLVTNLLGSAQEKDLSEPPNCKGYGRIRHFNKKTTKDWVNNPLPIDPACKALGLPFAEKFESQVFQNAACNWRCWYCFVPFELLSANPKHSAMLSCKELMELYLAEEKTAPMMDLSGGQPDLVPEWVPWMMQELTQRQLQDKIYLWSDDNLSNDFFWKYLSPKEIELVAAYQNYGRVCCFKGFDEESFSFNTLAEPNLFTNQFQLFNRLLRLGIDLYAYVTFTTPNQKSISNNLPYFLDALQRIDVNLPLRTIPLEVQVFSPVLSRMNEEKRNAITNQWLAIELWQKELESRFSGNLRQMNITDIKIGA